MSGTSGIEQFDFSINLLQVILWNRDKDEKLVSLLQSRQDWYDVNQTQFWNDWITDVFDLRTVNDFGCNVWAIILGLPLSIISPAVLKTTKPWGFGSETGTPKYNGNFFDFNFGSVATSPIRFTLEEKRLILQLRYRKLVTRPSMPNIAKILHDLLIPVYGQMYMLDGLNMTQTLVCKFKIPYALTFILGLDLLPRGEGVKLNIVSSASAFFGFGSETAITNTNLNFFHSGFASTGYVG